jgi:hypothetical protein
MKKRTEINWWIPGGSIAYIGSPKTRIEWMRLTWRGYLAWWKLQFLIIWILLKNSVGGKG